MLVFWKFSPNFLENSPSIPSRFSHHLEQVSSVSDCCLLTSSPIRLAVASEGQQVMIVDVTDFGTIDTRFLDVSGIYVSKFKISGLIAVSYTSVSIIDYYSTTIKPFKVNIPNYLGLVTNYVYESTGRWFLLSLPWVLAVCLILGFQVVYWYLHG
ncbi:hypothetical protein GEMRC1_007896 [Eukaryota sp. GEM-RC1]